MTDRLVPERPEHAADAERVLNRAFGPGRFVKSSERVRERGAVFEPTLSRVALDESGRVTGVCRIWRVGINGSALYFLGPLAVDPGAQRAGLGAALVQAAIDAVRALGAAGIVVVGAESFFRPLGFVLTPPGQISLPGPFDAGRLLWLELARGGFSGVHGEIGAPP